MIVRRVLVVLIHVVPHSYRETSSFTLYYILYYDQRVKQESIQYRREWKGTTCLSKLQALEPMETNSSQFPRKPTAGIRS